MNRSALYAEALRQPTTSRAAIGAPFGREWTRFTITDLAGARVIIQLLGGSEAFVEGKRPNLRPIEKACGNLKRLGVRNPLLDVKLAPHPRLGIVVDLPGLTLVAATGQAVFEETVESAREHLTFQRGLDVQVRRALDRATKERERPKGKLRPPEQLGLWANVDEIVQGSA